MMKAILTALLLLAFTFNAFANNISDNNISDNDVSHNNVSTKNISTNNLSEQTPLPPVESNEGWTLELDKNGIQIYTRDWPGSDFVAVKTVQTIKSSLSNIIANFLDVESFPEWVRDMKHGELVEDFDENMERSIYMHMGLPWPMKDRDIVIRQAISQDPKTLQIRMTESKHEGIIEEKEGLLRIPRVNSEFVLTPTQEGVIMTWQGHNEPGGFIPSFFVNWMIENIFYDSSLNMKNRFEAPEYRKTLSKNLDWIQDSNVE
jgi:hypothetical protein